MSLQVEHDLWVGGTPITTANATSGVTGGSGKATYDEATNTLTLNGYTFSGEGYVIGDAAYAIYYNGSEPLTVRFTGANSVEQKAAGASSTPSKSYGLHSAANVTFTATDAKATLSILGGAAKDQSCGIACDKAVSITNGTVSAAGGAAKDSYGISSADGTVIVNSVAAVEAKGATASLQGTVKNAVAGTGLVTSGSAPAKEAVPTSTEGQDLAKYASVRFPAAIDLATATTTVDVAAKTATVRAGSETVPATAYDLAYTKQGETTAVAAFPTEPGTYTVTATAKADDLAYINASTSAPFTIAAHEHTWGAPTYTWADDRSSCTASRACTDPTCNEVQTETVAATSAVTKEPTGTQAGTRTFTATFANAAFATQTITMEIPATGVTYKAAKGDGAQWVKGAKFALSFTFERSTGNDEAFDHFKELRIDGKTLAASNYTARSGSVVVAVQAAYLETLSTGKHTIEAVFDDGSATANFTVAAKSNAASSATTAKAASKSNASTLAKTRDAAPLLPVASIALVSAAVAAAVTLRMRRA